IERERGRERPQPNAPRTLDLDLILFGDHVMDEPGLVVPHPRFRERRFVLEPLTEIAPGLVDPVSRKPSIQLLIDLQRPALPRSSQPCATCRPGFSGTSGRVRLKADATYDRKTRCSRTPPRVRLKADTSAFRCPMRRVSGSAAAGAVAAAGPA